MWKFPHLDVLCLSTLLLASGSLVACGPVGDEEVPELAESAQHRALLDSIDAGFQELTRSLGSVDHQARGTVISAWHAYRHGEVCRAHARLLEAMAELQAARGRRHVRNVAAIDEAFALASSLANGLASRNASRGCPSMRGFGAAPALTLQASDNRKLRGSVAFGQPIFATHREGSRVFTNIQVPGTVTEESDTEGAPALPTYQQVVAVPLGATARLVSARFNARRQPLRLLVHPVQGEALEGALPEIPVPSDPQFDRPPFVQDAGAYASGNVFPAEPCVLLPARNVRGVNLAQVSCTVAQYVAATQELRLAESVSFEIEFVTSELNPAFATPRDLSPFEDIRVSLGSSAVINRSSIGQYLRPSTPATAICFGSELLIVTPSSLRAAADTLAAWKREKGITTRVRNIDGLTRDQIRAQVQTDYDTCLVRPSYLLLFGDDDTIGTFPTGEIPTDYPYTLADGGTEGPFGLPIVAVGRIPVSTLEEADIVVDKIVAYESNPPTSPSFYQNAAFAAFFQAIDKRRNDEDVIELIVDPIDREKRPFILTSERARNSLLANGYSADRVYRKTFQSHVDEYARYADVSDIELLPPAFLNNGDPLPEEIGPESDFPWDANSADMVATINAGRFLILHRDHAGAGGWADPPFSKSNVSTLTNGALTPVMYSINCQSGRFDDTPDNANFAERLIRLEGGGAVAVVGASRNTASGPNDHLALGMFDATWPNTREEYGDQTRFRRVGDILNYGKAYAASKMGLEVAKTQLIFRRFHLLGDPTLEMWTASPYRLPPLPPFLIPIEVFARPPIADPDPAPVIRVSYPVNGVVLTAYRLNEGLDAVPVARGRVENGEAVLTGYGDNVNPNALSYAASFEDAVSVPVRPMRRRHHRPGGRR